MKVYNVKIKSADKINHDVLSVVTEKPQGFSFIPGNATEISINKEGWLNKKRPFSFTSIPENDFLQFTIKTYPSHNGVTNRLLKIEEGDELILHDVFGAIRYKGEGNFIAGGAGVTPFISILRHLKSINEIGNNKLIFANKTKSDIFLEEEFTEILGENFINILSEERLEDFDYGMISENYLKEKCSDILQKFYICGPVPMIEAVYKMLTNLGVNEESIIIEEF